MKQKKINISLTDSIKMIIKKFDRKTQKINEPVRGTLIVFLLKPQFPNKLTKYLYKYTC